MDLYSGPAFWPVRDGLPANYPALRDNTSADVVVIGAGVTGALVAHALAKEGADVLVLDRAEVASGSSAATTGLLLYDTDSSLDELTRAVGAEGAHRAYQMGLEAIDAVEALVRTLDHPCGFSRRPSLYFASKRGHVPALREEFEHRAALGLDVEFLGPRDISSRYSFTAPAAIFGRGSAEIDCYRFTHAVLAAAVKAGARVHDRSGVKEIETRASGVRLRLDDGHAVEAGQVVCATGYDVGLALGRSPGQLASTWVFVSEPIAEFSGWNDRCLIWETSRPYVYMRTTDDGRLLMGGEDEPYPWKHRRRTTLVAKTERLITRARAMFPQLSIDPAYSWAGTFATTADGLPFIDQAPGRPGVWLALGYGGNGITFSAIAAHLLRDLLQGRPNRDAALFSFARG